MLPTILKFRVPVVIFTPPQIILFHLIPQAFIVKYTPQQLYILPALFLSPALVCSHLVSYSSLFNLSPVKLYLHLLPSCLRGLQGSEDLTGSAKLR